MSKNIVHIIRALPLNRDSRTSRYVKFIGCNVILNTWEDSYTSSKGLSRLKIGRFKYPLFITYPLYLLYLFLFGLIKVKSGQKVICMDLDTYIPIKIGTFFKKVDIYFDIVDPISQTRFRKLPFKKIFDVIEFEIIKRSNKVILPSCFRVNYYIDRLGVKGKELCKKYLVCENVPVLKTLSPSPPVSAKDNIRVGYFGSLDETRGIRELISLFINKDNVTLVFAGRGDLEKYVSELSKNSSNIEFLGSYSADDIEELYSDIDFSWAYYSPEIALHKYACPNKYYEHLAFKTPVIFNEIVPFSKIVNLKSSGLVVDDDLELLNFDVLYNLMKNFEYKLESFSDWDKLYKDYSFNLR